MPIEADLVQGELVTARRVRFPGALSSRKKPPRQRQSLALPCFCSAYSRSARPSPPSRAAPPLTQVLQTCRMGILAKRDRQLHQTSHNQVQKSRSADVSLGCFAERRRTPSWYRSARFFS